MTIRVLAALAVVALTATACTAPAVTQAPPSASASPAADSPHGGTFAAAGTFLQPFDSCQAVLDYFVSNGLEHVGPYGLGGVGVPTAVAGQATAGADAATAEAPPLPAPAGGEPFSGTNVQESGVDEPDIVKTDGRVAVAVARGALQIVDLAADAVVGRIDLDGGWGHELLLDGDDLLVLAREQAGGPGPLPLAPADVAFAPAFVPERSTITRVDLSDPAAPRVVERLRLEGGYASARLVDGIARVVVTSRPTGLAFTHPADGSLEAERAATERNRDVIRASDIDDWLPHFEVLGADGQPVGDVRRLLPCDALAHPAEFSGFATLSVLTVDLAAGLRPAGGAGVVAAGDTVYASPTGLYVATSPWGAWRQPFVADREEPAEPTTDLHAFDIRDPARTDYVASGTVAGVLLNQFALSEHDGHLRVAVTRRPDWVGTEPSSASLVVLRPDDGTLAEVGRVDGLGVTEQIQSVRYLGDLAAVVTFRQVDPLYLVDLTDPTAPRVLGDLKVPGFSAYLHPVGDGLLLGIGQDADPETGMTTGAQASLFDVSDPSAPTRSDQVGFGPGWSPVESDHRAFLWWPTAGLAVFPLETWPHEPDGTPVDGPGFSGAVALRVGPGGLEEAGRLTFPQPGPDGTAPPEVIRAGQPLQRTFVVGDMLYALSDAGLLRADLATLQVQATIGF